MAGSRTCSRTRASAFGDALRQRQRAANVGGQERREGRWESDLLLPCLGKWRIRLYSRKRRVRGRGREGIRLWPYLGGGGQRWVYSVRPQGRGMGAVLTVLRRERGRKEQCDIFILQETLLESRLTEGEGQAS